MKIISIIAILIVCISICYKLFGPSERTELYVLNTVYGFGSGFDDAVHEIVVSNKDRYKDTILEMLSNFTADSFNAEGSFLFGGILLDDSEINKSVVDLSKNHPDKSIRCYWHDLVNGRFGERIYSSDVGNNTQLLEVIDKGSTCQ